MAFRGVFVSMGWTTSDGLTSIQEPRGTVQLFRKREKTTSGFFGTLCHLQRVSVLLCSYGELMQPG